MKKDFMTIFTFITSILVTEQIFNIILLILGIISAVLTITAHIRSWIKKSLEDSIITIQEVDELQQTLILERDKQNGTNTNK